MTSRGHKLWGIQISALLTAFLVTACGGAGAGASSPASSDGEGEHMAALRSAGTMVCGTSADYPPFESVDADGNFIGFDMDLIREIGERLDLEIEIQDMEFDAIIASVQEEKIDCAVAALQITPERAEAVAFSTPYGQPRGAAVVKAGSDITLDSTDDIANYTVGCQASGTACTWIAENLVDTGKMPESQVSQYQRTDQIALDLKAGRIDIWLHSSAGSAAEEDDVEVVLPIELGDGGRAVAFPKEWTDVVAAVDEVINAMEDDGTLDALREEWGLETEALDP